MRLDHNPDRLCFSGSGLPVPLPGSSDRSNSLISLRNDLWRFLSFSRMASYASHVLPSNTSDLIHLLFRGFVSFLLAVHGQGGGNLLHEVTILQDVKSFLLSFPILSAEHNKVFP